LNLIPLTVDIVASDNVSTISLVQLECRTAFNERGPTLLETRVILWPDVRRAGLIVRPVVAVVVPLRVGSWEIDGLLAFKELDAKTHSDVEGDMAVHQPLEN
jgi:hypothetical protein